MDKKSNLFFLCSLSSFTCSRDDSRDLAPDVSEQRSQCKMALPTPQLGGPHAEDAHDTQFRTEAASHVQRRCSQLSDLDRWGAVEPPLPRENSTPSPLTDNLIEPPRHLSACWESMYSRAQARSCPLQIAGEKLLCNTEFSLELCAA